MFNRKRWYLVADIGGTNARFALQEVGHPAISHSKHYSVKEYSNFHEALFEYLIELEKKANISISYINATCFAVAAPVLKNQTVQFTNSSWIIDKKQIKTLLVNLPVYLINDFFAAAHAVPKLLDDEKIKVGGDEDQKDRPIVVLGPGTGLGVCSIVPCNNQHVVLDGEGGHIDFAPTNDNEIYVLNYLRKRLKHVSIERLLSGEGMLNIYLALCEKACKHPEYHSAAQISEAWESRMEAIPEQTVNLFLDVLLATAGNLALILGAHGGVYVSGGITPRLIKELDLMQHRKKFEAKGRFEGYLKKIPLYFVIKEDLGLVGSAHYLNKVFGLHPH